MATLKGDLHRQLAVVQGLAPAARTASANGAAFDRAASGASKGAGSVAVYFYTGTWTDGTHTPKVQDSDDNSTWNDAAASDLVGSFAAITSAANDVGVQAQSYIGTKRYVRGVLTVAGATTGALSACFYVGAGGEVNSALQAMA